MKKLDIYKKLIQFLEQKADAAHIFNLERYYEPEGVYKNQNYYFRLASSLQNGTSSGMDRSIRFNGENKEEICDVLFGCDFKKVLERYSKKEDLYKAFCEKIIDTGAVSRSERAQKALLKGNEEQSEKIKKRRTNWEKYSEGLFCGAVFLNSDEGEKVLQRMLGYNNAPISNFKDVEKDLKFISKEIVGLGTALSCDWLKECGCTWLVKPDIHIKKVYQALKEVEEKKEIDFSKIKDIDVIEYYYNWARELQQKGENVTAYQLDKMIWLICTGEFYLDKNEDIGRETIIKEIYK